MTTTTTPLTTIDCPNLKIFKTGKVRSVFDFGHDLLLVASDRVSSFDYVLNQGIPLKGQTLTSVSKFWFDKLDHAHHLISTNFDDFPEEAKPYRDQLEGRSMLVKKTDLIPVECVVRGYLVGSGWKDYQRTGEVCGHKLPEGLNLASKLPEPIFTPATKAESGHDENISVAQMTDQLGSDLTNYLEKVSLDIYAQARDFADEKGIIIADTKFEFGIYNGEVILIDEVLTPDSSRFWPKDQVKEGVSPPSFDKQIVRDYLESTGWDKNPPVPDLPDHIIQTTSNEYQTIAKRLTGQAIDA